MLHRSQRVGVVVLLPMLLVACASRDSAETALKQAEKKITDAHSYVIGYAPDQFKAVMEEYAAARKSFEEGHYRAAVRRAEHSTELIAEASRAAGLAKQEMERTWTGLRDSVPAMLAAIEQRLDVMARANRSPHGATAAHLKAARNELQTMTKGWEQATHAFKQGKVREALHAEQALRAKAHEVMKSLGMEAGQPPATPTS